MFAGFNLKIDKNDLIASHLFAELIRDQNNLHQQTVRATLDKYVKDDYLDASLIEEDWFPSIDADIFISHSHKDFDIALGLAGWFKEILGVTCFIDSCVWGYANDLLKTIDNKYCVNEQKEGDTKKTYNYDKRNQSTAHVHMILITALQKMINKTECLIFLNTPNSIVADDLLDEEATASPWIYSELAFSKMVRKKELSNYRKLLAHDGLFTAEKLDIRYKISTKHLIDIDRADLQYIWDNSRHKEPYQVMDDLYDRLNLMGYRLLEPI